MSLSKMTATERGAVGSLATIMSLRLIGLFMILPVLALYAQGLLGATPFLIGLAMGIYGLTQGALQIPFGMLSDHWGRKPVIALGLVIFLLGSVLAACSHSIYGLIGARALQGASAVGSTIIAMLADLTRPEQRTKAMAINGMTIGLSFSLAMGLGPFLASFVQVSGIFWLAALCGLLALVLLFTWAPTPSTHGRNDSEPDLSLMRGLLLEPQLARLNVGIFLLHAIFMASFVVIPIGLHQGVGVPGNQQWHLYLPTLGVAFIVSILLILRAEKHQQVKQYFRAGIVLLGFAEILFLLFAHHFWGTALALTLFFTGFSLLEAFLPSYVSRMAPATRKGTAMGIYSCAQFLGIFLGGTVGGWLYGTQGLVSVYLFSALLALLWLAISYGMKNPQHRHPAPDITPAFPSPNGK